MKTVFKRRGQITKINRKNIHLLKIDKQPYPALSTGKIFGHNRTKIYGEHRNPSRLVQ